MKRCRGRQLRCSLGQTGQRRKGCWLHFFKTLDLKGRLGCSIEGCPAVEAEPGLRGSPGAAGAGLQPVQDLPNDAGRGQGFVHRDGSTLLEAAGGPFGQDRSGTGGLVVSPGVNAFWSADVRKAAALEQVADVERPMALPPLAGPPVTFGPVQALGVDHGGSGLLQPGVGPEQAPSHWCLLA